jgi:hypothetical protein
MGFWTDEDGWPRGFVELDESCEEHGRRGLFEEREPACGRGR